MAKICAHGEIIGTVEYLTKAKRYMSDGMILKNVGFGWKLAGKVKAGVQPQDAFDRAKAHLETQLADKPDVAVYLRELHQLAGVGKRWKLHAAVSLMPDDCDGVWSEACDGYGDNCHADVDEARRGGYALAAPARVRPRLCAPLRAVSPDQADRYR